MQPPKLEQRSTTAKAQSVSLCFMKVPLEGWEVDCLPMFPSRFCSGLHSQTPADRSVKSRAFIGGMSSGPYLRDAPHEFLESRLMTFVLMRVKHCHHRCQCSGSLR